MSARKEFTEIDFKIKHEICTAIMLLSNDEDILSNLHSWKETLDGETVLSDLIVANKRLRGKLEKRLQYRTRTDHF